MDLSEFTANYAYLGDDELLRLWADRNTLVSEAAAALEGELQRRGLNKQNATRVKKRLDALAAREKKGPLVNQIADAKNERSMRHFVGWEEPKFYSPYGSRDIRKAFAYIRYKYRVWKAFHDHTGRWPVFSICFHFVSWIALFGCVLAGFAWVEERKWKGGWDVVAVVGGVLVALSARELGARLMRKLDWKRCGNGAPSSRPPHKSRRFSEALLHPALPDVRRGCHSSHLLRGWFFWRPSRPFFAPSAF